MAGASQLSLLVVSLIIATTAVAERRPWRPPQLELATKSIITVGGRLEVKLPLGATEQSSTRQRVVYAVTYRGATSTIAMSETFQRRGIAFDRLAQRAAATRLGNPIIEKFSTKALSGVLAYGAKVDHSGLVAIAYVSTDQPQDTVQEIEFTVDPSTDTSYHWIVLARDVLEEIAIGKHRTQTERRKLHLGPEVAWPDMVVADGHVLTYQAGAGVIAYRLQKVVELGALAPTCDLVIDTVQPKIDPTLGQVELTILGEDVVVQRDLQRNGHAASFAFSYLGWWYAVSCEATSRKDVDELMHVFETLTPGHHTTPRP